MLQAFCASLDSQGQLSIAYETGAALYGAASKRWALHSTVQRLGATAVLLTAKLQKQMPFWPHAALT